jgi:hypothetical protein
MARITSYSLDQTITVSDKVVGTDAATGTVRNYTVGELSSFINTASLGNYDFDTTQIPGAGTDNFVLTYDNSTGKISLEAAAAQAAFNIVDDTTPQLGGTLDANGQIIDMGTNTITDIKVGQWDTAYGWGDHSTQGYITSETSHADVVVDGDFTSQGIMLRGASSGTYSILTDSSTNWNTAYSWGDHSTQGYVTSSGVTSVTGTAPVVSSGGTTPAISMAAATTSTDGYLTSTDWNTFNNKLSSVADDTTPTLGGELDANSNKIVNLTNPTAAQDAATKAYVDAAAGAAGDVTGPASSTNNSIAVYDGTTGKVIKNDTGVTIDADSNVILENWPESDGEFRGDVDGGIRFTAQADGALSKGDVVYISGFSGANTLVAKAQANSSSTMPAFGFVNRAALNGATVQIITFGNIYGSGTYPLDTITDSEGNSLTVGDEIYVSSTVSGGYTNVKPSNETNLIQNIGKIVRVNANNGVIKAGGAGRTNATPNLDSGKMFLGNASNQSASVAMSGDVTIDNTGVTTVGTINSVAVATVTSGAALGAAALPKSGGAMTGAITGNQEITGRRPIVSDSTPNIDLTLGIHEGTFIYSDSGLPVTVNIMDNATQAFPVGTEIDLIQAGAGVVTLTPAIGVNLNGANTAIPITAQWGGATLKQITVDNWIIVGKI